MDRENLWTRRSNSSKLSLSTDKSDRHESKDNHGRDAPGPKRFGSMSSSKNNPFNTVAPLSTHAVSSPTAGGSSAFGLGSGAFASFGSATKTPKTPGTAFDFARSNPSTPTGAPSQEKKELEKEDKRSVPKKSIANLRPTSSPATEQQTGAVKGAEVQFPLKYTWVIWYRPPTSKNSDYEKSTKAMCKMGSVQQFWAVYAHLKHPSALPTVSDYHFFKEGIRPVWEDEENKKGGKWIMRLKKGVADRYWEELLMAMVGDQFAEAGEEVCGAVVSVRPGEDVFSIWTKNDGGRNVKIRETIKRVLSLPADTNIIWKSHDDSIVQRSAIDQARQDKTGQHSDKRRNTLLDDSGKERSTAV